jgi:hypothetical protein
MNRFVEHSQVVTASKHSKDYCNYNTRNEVFNVCLLVVWLTLHSWILSYFTVSEVPYESESELYYDRHCFYFCVFVATCLLRRCLAKESVRHNMIISTNQQFKPMESVLAYYWTGHELQNQEEPHVTCIGPHIRRRLRVIKDLHWWGL